MSERGGGLGAWTVWWAESHSLRDLQVLELCGGREIMVGMLAWRLAGWAGYVFRASASSCTAGSDECLYSVTHKLQRVSHKTTAASIVQRLSQPNTVFVESYHR